ncbi:molybdenum cofactor biosynthesis protein B [miscellaneous Crenarchaeota group-15 archaeon DG-45]|uniref:Molybdenum cofactor biosynthesis protein B n=1 Tax=miscellaneous Crenarchaeota group-15 archaeon DG-45 TaxID=1685127 RepID=A0A0M0BRR7_9ARCH|nr:MAG: molybdenum cofactor biosynthesis protein B [miscellaneous Crenarchaeota group-15 archaeon DG-45]
MHEHRRDQSAEAACAVLVTSDTRRPGTDETGKRAIQLLEEAGHSVAAYKIVRNDTAQIREALEGFLGDDGIQVVITSGGTGIGAADKTVDAVSELLDKRIEGFGELFRRLSYEEIGGAAIISRAAAGVAGGKLVFCLPGSMNAVELGLRRIILPSLGHMLWELSRR